MKKGFITFGPGLITTGYIAIQHKFSFQCDIFRAKRSISDLRSRPRPEGEQITMHRYHQKYWSMSERG